MCVREECWHVCMCRRSVCMSHVHVYVWSVSVCMCMCMCVCMHVCVREEGHVCMCM